MLLSLIIPIYNRPDELEALLASLMQQDVSASLYEVIIVEDGSQLRSEEVVHRYSDEINLHYIEVPNGGPSRARNIGAAQAVGDWLVILDSDVILPQYYLSSLLSALEMQPCDAWGGPDAARADFSPIQQAINYAMTSPLTTGGIRGGERRTTRVFYPRSFNMGCRRALFEELGGFDESMRFGEDIDFSLRLYASGAQVLLYPECYVYHRRRVDFKKYFKQVFNSGIARVHLTERHPGSMRLTYLLPSIFVVGVLVGLCLSLWYPWLWGGALGGVLLLGVDAWIRIGRLSTAGLAICASLIQFTAYGSGYLIALVRRYLLGHRAFNSFSRTLYD